MERRALAAVPALALTLALLPSAPAAAAPADTSRGPSPVYLALGDSVAAGVGALPYRTGYPERTAAALGSTYNAAAGKTTGKRTGVALDLVNASVGGATTRTLLRDQLPAALSLIAERQADRDPRNDVEVITVTIGGNDVFTPTLGACVLTTSTAGCQTVVDAQLATLRTNLGSALEQLTAAAPRAEVVVTTYYNPIGSCVVSRLNPAAPAIAEVVLEGGTTGFLTLAAGVNDVIRAEAARTGAQVAELHGQLEADQYVGGSDCLHPDQSGHDEIGQIVAATLAR